MNGIEKIVEKIIGDAESYEKVALAEAEKQVADIADTYSSETAYLLAGERTRLKTERETLHARAESAAAAEKRRMVLEEKSRLVSAVYDKAREYFLQMPDGEYRDFLFGILQKVLSERVDAARLASEVYGESGRGGEYSVSLSPRDSGKFGKDFIADFRARYKGKLPETVLQALTLGDSADIGGGLILSCGDMECNCSIDMLIDESKNKNDAEVYKILFGES